MKLQTALHTKFRTLPLMLLFHSAWVVTVVEIAGGGACAGLGNPSALVVVDVALGYCIRSGSCRRVEMIERVPHQGKGGGAAAQCRAVPAGSGNSAAARHFAQFGHMPIGVVYSSADQRRRHRCLSEFH